MKTAIFWKTPDGVVVFSEDSPVEPPLDIADYSGSHIDRWTDAQRKRPALTLYEYEDFPRGRLIWDDKQKTYFFYADEKILSDPVAVDDVLRQTGVSRNDFAFRFCRDPHYRTP